MTKTAIIGGTGLTALQNLNITGSEKVTTGYGEPSASLTTGMMGDKQILFLPRHGSDHTIPPHKINYRANIQALKNAGADRIIAVNAVGGITRDLQAGGIMFPDQIIDYTWSREHTFFDGGEKPVVHVDFTRPYTDSLREILLQAAQTVGIAVTTRGTYAATQGPRLETAAEIDKLEKDGCHIVGMTGMPEAALARELDMDYVCISVIANLAAGRHEGEITMEEIETTLAEALAKVSQLLETAISLI